MGSVDRAPTIPSRTALISLLRLRMLHVALAIVVLVAMGAGSSRCRAGAWREYRLLVLAGCAGAAAGVAIGQVTSRISPAYYEFAKRVPDPAPTSAPMLELGMQAGFGLGVVGAAVLLAVRPSIAASLRLGAVSHLRLVDPPIGAALLGAATLLAVAPLLGPSWLPDGAEHLVPRVEREAFFNVWMCHIGAYVGALAGLLWTGASAGARPPEEPHRTVGP